MGTKKNILVGLIATLLNIACLAQEDGLMVDMNQGLNYNKYESNYSLKFNSSVTSSGLSILSKEKRVPPEVGVIHNNIRSMKLNNFLGSSFNQAEFNLGLKQQKTEPFLTNKRNLYSSMWAFASLNYIYADLTGLMDKNILSQYQNGVVNGTKITPDFLGVAAVFMQIPLANVFLPQVIKNERTLRWVQIASGTLMTLVQAGTLFVGKPTPHYAVYSAFEIAATTFITIDAIKWKAKSNKKPLMID